MALFTALLVAIKISGIALTISVPAPSVYSSAITPENIFLLTNLSRQNNNLPQLTWNDTLAKAAQAKAQDMAEKGYFSHTSPDGRLPWDFITAAGYEYINAGENLAEGFFEAENTSEAWMNSPGHRANILNKNYQELGVGQAAGKLDGHNTIFVVQMFGSRLNAPGQQVLSETKPSSISNAPQSIAQVPITEKTIVPPTIINSRIALVDKSKLRVTVVTSDNVVKALLNMGDKNVLLDPKGENVWEAVVDLSATVGRKVTIEVIDNQSNQTFQELATISETLVDAYSPEATVSEPEKIISVMGYEINWNVIEKTFYLLFTAMLISVLVLAIGIKKHVQHIDLIANASFVSVLAIFLWLH